MELKNLTVRDVNILKWAVRNLRLDTTLGNAKSRYYREEQIIEECERLNDIINEAFFNYFENR